MSSERPPKATPPANRPRLLVFIVAYNAEKTIEQVLKRIPAQLLEKYHVETLVIDDSSRDMTFEVSDEVRKADSLPFKLHVLFNPVNQGYGGNQKIGYHFAMHEGFDFVALVHGDGQYAPECLPDLLEPLRTGEADAVFGSRMMTQGAAIKGGMPLYKFVGNKILTWTENKLLRTDLSEFHSGYRVYSVDALRKIPFDLNTNDFHFDTEIIIQLVFAKLKIKELPIPTYYGDEICHVDGIRYAWDVVKAVSKARVQETNLLYDRKYDCRPADSGSDHYQAKLDFHSSHTVAASMVAEKSHVLDLGCAGGFVSQDLKREKGVTVTGVDLFPLAPDVELDQFFMLDLNRDDIPVDMTEFDTVLMLDVIEHLAAPEEFVEKLREASKDNPNIKILVCTGNVAFIVTRLLHMFGMFNYGKRGILDMTHTRLFTATTIRSLFEQNSFDVVSLQGIPAPWPLVFGKGWFGRTITKINSGLCRIWVSMFAYQLFLEVTPRPHLDYLLKTAHEESVIRSQQASAG